MHTPPSVSELYAEAHRLYAYEPETGLLRWKVDTKRARAGDCACHAISEGYLYCRIFGRRYRAHRVVWLMHHGYFPKEVDHRNRNRKDNRIGNLREATRPQNAGNRVDMLRPNAGVKKRKDRKGVFIAQICINGKRHYLGQFADEASANAAYVKASREMRGNFSPV